MFKIALVLLLASLAGCAGPKAAANGNFAKASPAVDKKVADDAVKKLAGLYPPAITRFDLQQVAADSFGTSLVATLRAQGYALLEPKSASKSGADLKNGNRTLSYVFDQPSGTELYRITLTIGDQSLSRVYLAKDGSVAPAGYWVRKE
ncbi:conjugal transfer protein TrbH [Massilia niabensis]|uniref:Conjugal transfer protein TrbH n=1 Tax=Massilia niabensis TaxID=544910 RepID=A0ABW0L6P3_9BURK